MPTMRRLVLFTRYPAPGQTKTRLIPALGPEDAARLSRRIVERLLKRLERLPAGNIDEIEVRFHGATKPQMQSWLGHGFRFVEQGQGDIGEKMARAFREAAADDVAQTVLCGSDIPQLDDRIIMSAFTALARSDVVLGPARDGGYYLIGLKQPADDLFCGICWSTETVLEQTKTAIARKKLRYCLVDALSDLDVPADLQLLADDEELREFVR
jgi:rSAM/selenodomain-associated transferase 1